MSQQDWFKAAASLAKGVVAAVEGRPLDAAGHGLDAALDLVPAPVAQKLLSEAAWRRQLAIGDLEDGAKFGDEEP